MQPSILQSQQILARAFAAHQAGNIAQAEFLYKLVLQADKKQFDALHMLGVIEGQRGNFSAGLRRLNEALRIRPNSADALINRGSYILAFASYNAGRRRVKEWIEQYGDPRDRNVDPIDWIERIPFSETRNYVERVIENMQVYRARLENNSKLLIEADLRPGG